MTNTSSKIVFFGNERLVSGLPATDTPILRSLIENGYNIVAVVSHHSDGQSRSNRALEVGDIAKQHNIPVLLPESPDDIIDQIKAMNADAAVLVAYGRIISQNVIDIFPKGIINIHPSLLPKYRGPTPIESAIANGDNETGVSIMKLTAGLDEGPVYTQQIVSLNGHETKFDLYEKQASVSTTLLLEILPQILDGSLHPKPQDNDQATYSKSLSKEDGQLDTAKLSADQAERLVRAYLGFPKTKINIMGHNIIIIKAHTSTQAKTPLDLLCSDGAYLSIDELIAPSGRQMDAKAFLNGYATT